MRINLKFTDEQIQAINDGAPEWAKSWAVDSDFQALYYPLSIDALRNDDSQHYNDHDTICAEPITIENWRELKFEINRDERKPRTLSYTVKCRDCDKIIAENKTEIFEPFQSYNNLQYVKHECSAKENVVDYAKERKCHCMKCNEDFIPGRYGSVYICYRCNFFGL